VNTNLKKIEPEADGVVKDGQSISVRMQFMDGSMEKAIADALAPKPFIADHHRPNSAILTDAEKKAADDRYNAAQKKLSDAWKNPEPIYAGAHAPQGGHGHVLPISGNNTSLRTNDPMSPGHAPGAPTNAAELDAIQQANQAKYNSKIESAWKNPVNQGAK
jgi:hypothetical protein